MAKQEGGCLCRDVRYATSADPLSVNICSCNFCQRATGAAAMVEPLFARSPHAVVHGMPTTFDILSAGSGKNIKIHFCSRCGTKLFQEFERFPDFIGVYAGTFDDPGWFDRSPANTRYIFLESAQNGTIIPAGYDTYQGSPPRREDGTPLPGIVFDRPHVIRRPSAKSRV